MTGKLKINFRRLKSQFRLSGPYYGGSQVGPSSSIFTSSNKLNVKGCLLVILNHDDFEYSLLNHLSRNIFFPCPEKKDTDLKSENIVDRDLDFYK